MFGPSALALRRCAEGLPFPRWRNTIAAVLAIWLLLGVAGGHCGIPRAQFREAYPQQLSSAPGAELVANVGLADLVDRSESPCPAKFVTAVLPRSAMSLVAFATVAIVTVAILLADFVAPGGRSPPTGRVSVLAGRARLTRFCLARR